MATRFGGNRMMEEGRCNLNFLGVHEGEGSDLLGLKRKDSKPTLICSCSPLHTECKRTGEEIRAASKDRGAKQESFPHLTLRESSE